MLSNGLAEGFAQTAKRSDAPLRLFCFHHAGGHEKTAFMGWQRKLGERIEVVPVGLAADDVLTDHLGPGGAAMARIIERVNTAVDPHAHVPHVFYGHSMGALVAYRLTLLRQTLGLALLPRRLLVGAYPGPHLPHRLIGAARLPDAELEALLPTQSVRRFQVAGEALRRAAMARLRAHLGICDSAASGAENAPDEIVEAAGSYGRLLLECPIEVFTGRLDSMVTEADAAAWRRHTRAGCRMHHMPGGHFFTRDTEESKTAFFARLSSVLAECASAEGEIFRNSPEWRIAS